MGLIIYNLLVILYKTGIKLVSPWNPKARSWVNGRKPVLNDIRSWVSKSNPGEVVWMHCASLGEFEQGRPLLEKIRAAYPGCSILLTFFSASGYEVQKKYQGADFVCYLPVDTSANARQFVETVRPSLVLWVKYEYWYHFLHELKQKDVPLLLISGIFQKHQLFFKWYGHSYRKILKCFSHLFVQDTNSKNLLERIGLSGNITVSGDTRFDRVIEIASQFQPINLIEDFCGAHQVIVAGSTWQEDEESLDHFANTHPEIKFIIAPHQIDQAHLAVIKKLFRFSIFYSEFSKTKISHNDGVASSSNKNKPPYNVLVIDNIGMLSRLYRYATITYVGGGFGTAGLHNVLEAAVYGKPVVFGPEYGKFVEPGELIACGGAFSVSNALELEKQLISLLENSEQNNIAGRAAMDYVQSRKGATEKIMNYILGNKVLARG